MRAKVIGGIVLGIFSGWLVWGGGAAAVAQSITGAWDSHIVQESYRISIGVDAIGKPRKDEKVDEIRTHYNLPQHYGNLIGVTGHDDKAVFWYQDSAGVIRNSIFPAADQKLVRIEYTATSRYEEDILP